MTTFGDNDEGWKNPSSDEIKSLLETVKTVAVVGLSSNPARPSYGVASFLKSKGYRIIPVNPVEKEWLGEEVYADLKSIPFAIDIVDVFRKSEAAPAVTDEAIEVGAKAVWLQEGVVSPEAFARGEKAGLFMVMDRCMAKEYSRLIK